MTELNEFNTETTVIDETEVDTDETSEESENGDALGKLMLIGGGLLIGAAGFGLYKAGKWVGKRIDKWAVDRVNRKNSKKPELEHKVAIDNKEQKQS